MSLLAPTLLPPRTDDDGGRVEKVEADERNSLASSQLAVKEERERQRDRNRKEANIAAKGPRLDLERSDEHHRSRDD